jgi:hypothetical protein
VSDQFVVGMARDIERLRHALREVLEFLDAMVDDPHSYCATQAEDFENQCTCGYDDNRARWDAALGLDPS